MDNLAKWIAGGKRQNTAQCFIFFLFILYFILKKNCLFFYIYNFIFIFILFLKKNLFLFLFLIFFIIYYLKKKFCL